MSVADPSRSDTWFRSTFGFFVRRPWSASPRRADVAAISEPSWTDASDLIAMNERWTKAHPWLGLTRREQITRPPSAVPNVTRPAVLPQRVHCSVRASATPDQLPNWDGISIRNSASMRRDRSSMPVQIPTGYPPVDTRNLVCIPPLSPKPWKARARGEVGLEI